MKKYLISTVAVMVVLAVTLGIYTQAQAAGGPRPEGQTRGGMGRFSERMQAAITTIEAQVAKLKEGMKARAEMPRFRGGQEGAERPSEEEMAKMREQRMKIQEQQQAAVSAIEEQLMIFKGRQLQTEHNAAIAELEATLKLAKEEKAEKTAKHIQGMIDKRNKAFEATVEKLGIRFQRRRGEEGGMGGGPRPGEMGDRPRPGGMGGGMGGGQQ